MQSLSVYDNRRIIALNFNLNTKLSETTDSRETVGTREKVVDLRRSVCNRAEHNAAVGDGFVSWYCNFSF